MSEFILIVWISVGGYPAMTTAIFDSKKACVEAGRAMQSEQNGLFRNAAFVCVPKGDKQ